MNKPIKPIENKKQSRIESGSSSWRYLFVIIAPTA